jgi:hypothetical protein
VVQQTGSIAILKTWINLNYLLTVIVLLSVKEMKVLDIKKSQKFDKHMNTLNLNSCLPLSTGKYK